MIFPLPFRSLIRHGRKQKADPVDCVVRAANHLDLSEFEVFRLAYEDWFGRKPSDSLIGRDFSEYLKTDFVPFYVAHFARKFS